MSDSAAKGFTAMANLVTTQHTEPPAGFSVFGLITGMGQVDRYSQRQLDNGVVVTLVESFEVKADRSVEPRQLKYLVMLGVCDIGDDLPCPFECPADAAAVTDGENDWFADFGNNEEAALHFSRTEGMIPEGQICRELVVTERDLDLYFLPISRGGHLEAAKAQLNGDPPLQLHSRQRH